MASGGFVRLLALTQDQCVEITEESKALLEEYNKTVSFLLSQTLEVRCPKPCVFVSSLALLHPIPTSLFPCSPALLADAKYLHDLTQTPVFTLTCN